MSKENKSGASSPLELTNRINRWNYKKSVEKMRPLIEQWKGATKEILRELYLAREYLTNQKGQYRDPNGPNYLINSWSGYCGEIGLKHQTVNNWLKSFQFVPREISSTGKDTLLLLDAPHKEDTTADRALMQSRVEEYLRTGDRPDGWRDDKEEAELQRRLKEAEYAELAEKFNAPVVMNKTDYFADAMRRSKDIAAFKLKDLGQMQAQIKVFKYIEAYLSTFDDSETRSLAAFNLALKTHAIANNLAEENFRLKESAAREDAQ